MPSVMALVAAGGYIQVAGQAVFWCGRVEAFPGTTILAVLCLAHTALYLAAAARTRWDRLYHLSQLMTIPVLIVAIAPVLWPHPRTLVFLTSVAAIMAMTGWRRGGVFAVAQLGFLAAIGQIPFGFHGVIVRDWMVWGALAVATGLAGWVARSTGTPSWSGLARPFMTAPSPALRVVDGRARPDHDRGAERTVVRLIPLTLLLFPLLRARLPDIAYDSLSYKVTIPYQMAEWRTGDSAIIDGYMIGTNLQEMLNTLLLMLTGDWRPQLISTLSFVLLVLITPLAFPAARFPAGARRAVLAFAGVAAFVLTEAGIAQGTAYQEPLLLLFLVASLIRCPAWPGFLAMAAAVKMTAIFIAPLILLYHALGYRAFWRSPRSLVVGVLIGTLALGPQLGRNLVFSGRLLGMSETLAAVTDPPGPHRIMAVGIDRYDVRPRGGLLNNAVQSACNIWLLDGLCSVRYKGVFESGFSVFPASRAALLAVVFAVAVCLRRRRPVGFLAFGAFGLGYAGLLGIVSEGRYFLPLSLGFAILLMIDLPLAATLARKPWAIALGCWLIGADLLPGTFTNASWICRRDITAAVDNPPLKGPRTPVEAFLASLTERYKQSCAPPGLPPVILAETDRMDGPYLGTQRIFHVFTQQMIRGFIAANPARQTRMADAILAVVEEHGSYARQVLGPSLADYTQCYDGDGLRVLCSLRLAPNGRDCAQSLY
jgi:hypothetical protein